MNAAVPESPEEATERTARHRRMLAELAELGMQLARAAAAKTLATLAAEPPPQAAPAPGPKPRAAAKTPDYGVLFTRLVRSVQSCLAQEARLTAGALHAGAKPGGRQRGEPLPPRPADPRRTPLREAIHTLVENQPDRAILRRAMTDALEAELAADPAFKLKNTDILQALCAEFGLELNLRRFTDAQLGWAITPPP